MNGTFAERRIDADGTPILCRECGTGAVVVALHGASGGAPTELEKLLADKFRVLALESSGFAARSPQDGAALLAKALAALRLDKYGVIADAAIAAAALSHAAEAAMDTLVLLSPDGHPAIAEARLRDVKVPTLILIGTNDKPAATAFAGLCADTIPEAYPMLVYDAGPAMASERPAALFEAVADFLERRGRFVLERQASAIHP